MKNWYLMESAPTDNAFAEALRTELAVTVLLCNHDLSKQEKIRCIIQGNTPDTRLKSMERTGLFQCGTVKAGMYIFFENRYWLITGYPGTNGIYEKAVMNLCQYKLKWQNQDGSIVERWCHVTSASKHDTGETGNSTIVSASNRFTILMPDDKDGLDLDGRRVFIDKKEANPRKVFKVTRSDEVLYDYGKDDHGSILSFIADRDEFNPDVDNQELKLCNYIDPHPPALPEEPAGDEDSGLSAAITGIRNLKVGYPRTYSVTFTDRSGDIVDQTDFRWNIVSDFEVLSSVHGQTIELLVEDESLIDSSLYLQVTDRDGTAADEIKIDILGLLGR